MSEHPVELPEPEPEEETSHELEEVIEVTREVISSEDIGILEAESTRYAHEAEVLDRRIEAQERIEVLEVRPGGDPPPRPARRALQRADAVRQAAVARRPVPPDRFDARYAARVKDAAGRFMSLASTVVTEKIIPETRASVVAYGVSLDAFLGDTLAAADVRADDALRQRVADEFAAHGVSPDRLGSDLRGLTSSAVPGGKVDVVTAAECAERILGELGAMRAALDATGASLGELRLYLATVAAEALGVQAVLDGITSGAGVSPDVPTQRCLDLSGRLIRDQGRLRMPGVPEPHLTFDATGRTTSWDTAVDTARTALRNADIEPRETKRLDAAMRGLDPQLDAEVNAVLDAIQQADRSTIDQALAAAWRLRRRIDAIYYGIQQMEAPVEAKQAVGALQNMLSALAGWVATLAAARGALLGRSS